VPGGELEPPSADVMLDRLLPLLPVIGATRLSVVSGLDVLGIPVAQVCRPLSRSVSVSQGKGFCLAEAKVSAIGEALESWHAERIGHPLWYGGWTEVAAEAPVVDVARLARPANSLFHADAPLLWIEGRDLVGGATVLLPLETVHLDYRLPRVPGSGCFLNTSTGLAAGASVLGALGHALAEVVERDAVALWNLRPDEARARRRIDLGSVGDDACAELLARFGRADVAVAAWDLTTDVGVATVEVTVVDRGADANRRLPTAGGYGCHPRRAGALARALLEAAQSRVTLIAGSRDDHPPAGDRAGRDPWAIDGHRRAVDEDEPQRTFDALPDAGPLDPAGAVVLLLDRLRAVGSGHPVMVDLSRPEVGIPVVRVVVPGTEMPSTPLAPAALGERGRAALAASTDRAQAGVT
jgi:ribosomal protein S12 methylthiotransferase accessory factor